MSHVENNAVILIFSGVKMKERDYRTIILNCAEDIISRKGIKSLTVANIVQQSKLSNRNFYECFSSKEELLKVMRQRFETGGIEMPDERQQLLLKAEEGIARYGFNNITLEAIAKEAGLKRGAIYKHFTDKYELLECCIEYQFNKTKGIMDLVFQSCEEDPEGYLRKYVENYAFFLNHSYDSSIFTEAWSHMNYRTKVRDLTYDLQEYFRGHVSNCLQAGIRQGIFKKDLDLPATTALISMLFNGMAFHLSKKSAGGERVTKACQELILSTTFKMIRV